jgi:trimeric autotransporter adhesin
MKIIYAVFLTLLFVIQTLCQTGNITNTLGSSGVYTIKDASTTFLSLNQTNGLLSLNNNLSIPYTTSSSVGVILKGTDSFIHNYQAVGTTGWNTFIGINAGNFTLNGSGSQASFNTGTGFYSLKSLTTGNFNSAFGTRSLLNNTTGSDNSAFGEDCLISNTIGNYNCAFGTQALWLNTTGSDNSAFGLGTLTYNTSGTDNSAFGCNALYYNTTSDNSAFGAFSLFNNTSGGNNSAFGYQSLYSNSTGYDNSAMGYQSLYFNTTGYLNSAFGIFSLINNTTGYYNAAFGGNSLRSNTTGNSISAFGDAALFNNTTGSFNSACGFASLDWNSTGFFNSALGSYSLFHNTTGNQNTAVGYNSLFTNVSGFQNTAVGDSALYYNTGNYNTAIGYNAGSNVTSGANLTLIGIDANPSAGNALDEITLGNIYVQHLRCNVQTITSLSDARDKKNIRDLPLGLDFLMTLKPRLYNWDRRDWYKDGKPDGSKMQKTPTAGFIAQELDTAQINANAEYLNLVLKTNPNKLEATPGNLLPIIVKAVQELKQENDSLKAQLKNVNEIKMELAEIKSLKEELNRELRLLKSGNRDTIFDSLLLITKKAQNENN